MKGDINGDMELVCLRAITMVPFLKIRVANEDTTLGTRIKFAAQDFGYMNIHGTTKDSGFQVWLMGCVKEGL